MNQIIILFANRLHIYFSRLFVCFIFLLSFCTAGPVFGETLPQVMQTEKTITGTVISNLDGELLIGVSVAVKGSTIGTVTDINGKYSIKASQGQTLVFSYIGFIMQEIVINNQNTIDVLLVEDTQNLDEVIVVGYGTMKKSDISGSVVSVDREQMMKRNPINLVQGLQGAAAGVLVTRNSGDPEGDATIRIRGVATVNGSADPLYVVDGIQVGGNANFINPADVERMEVLKDASATAIYGARGANGVILITTRKGTKGATRIDLSANFGVQQMIGKLDVADAELFAYSVRQGHLNDKTAIQNKAFGDDYTGRLRNIDWQDVMTQTAIQQNYMLSVSGGNDKTQSAFSVGYLKNEGVIIGSNFSRLTARGNINHKVKDFIEIGGNLAFVHSEKVGSGNLRDYATLTPTMDYVDEVTGEFISHHYNDRTPDGDYYAFMQVSAEGDIQKGQDNPFAVKKKEDKTPSYNNKFMGSAYVDLKLFKGLTFRTIGSYTLSTYDGSGFSLINKRTLSGAQTNNFWMSQSQSNNTELESYFTYNWANDHNNLTIMAGNTVSNSWGHWVSASARDFLSDSYRDISMTSDQSTRTGEGAYNLKTRYLSWYGRMSYTLMDRYILTGTIRRDGSSNFGSGNRWGTFPSAALAWRLSEEDFIRDINFFNNLKFRLGWGQTGNAGSTNLSVAQLSSNRIAYNWGQLGGSSSEYNNTVGFTQLKEIDTNLKWETNTQTNIGVDIGIFNQMLNITVDYFFRDSKDLLLYRNMRPSTGYGNVYTNAGHIRNRGVEFNIAFNKNINDWHLGATLSGSSLKNEAIEVGDPIYYTTTDDGDNWDEHSVTMNGYAVGSFYGYVVEGVFKNQAEVDAANSAAVEKGHDAYQLKSTAPGDYKYKDLNNDGMIDGQDRKVLGNGFPKFNYGLNLSAGYKNFDAMVYLYGVAGVDIFSYASMKMTNLSKTGGGVQNTLKEYINNAWTENNTNSSIARMTIIDNNTNAKASSAYVRKGDFLKISNVQIGYTFPKSMLSPLKMESARVYISVDNLACFSSYNKYGDPEVGNSNVVYTGFDGGRYPYPRTFSAGLNVQF